MDLDLFRIVLTARSVPFLLHQPYLVHGKTTLVFVFLSLLSNLVKAGWRCIIHVTHLSQNKSFIGALIMFSICTLDGYLMYSSSLIYRFTLWHYTTLGRFVSASSCTETAAMIIRLGRLTPGYFRLLQVCICSNLVKSCVCVSFQIAYLNGSYHEEPTFPQSFAIKDFIVLWKHTEAFKTPLPSMWKNTICSN